MPSLKRQIIFKPSFESSFVSQQPSIRGSIDFLLTKKKNRIKPGRRFQLLDCRKQLEGELRSLNSRIRFCENMLAPGVIEAQLQLDREQTRLLKLNIKRNQQSLQNLLQGYYDKAMESEIKYWKSMCRFQNDRHSRLVGDYKQYRNGQSSVEVRLGMLDKYVQKLDGQIRQTSRRLGQAKEQSQRVKELFKKQTSRIIWKQLGGPPQYMGRVELQRKRREPLDRLE